jgi:formylglycine-generating enzyme required for sulfatase activity
MFYYLLSLILFLIPFVANTSNNKSTLMPGEIFQDRLQDGSLGPEMVVIPAGQFQMGNLQSNKAPNEYPVPTFVLDRFAIGRSEVTFAHYDHFVEVTGRAKPDDRGWGRGKRPVIFVSFYDAMAYTAWLSEQTGHEYRLPTEAEWEYAARAGTKTRYWWGNRIGQNRAACDGCRAQWGYEALHEMTAPVCSFPANPFGLCDTVGNVWEWTCSAYEKPYQGKEQQCSFRKNKPNARRAIRGGSWFSKSWQVRVSKRSWNLSDYRRAFVGFRVWRRILLNDK